MIVDWQIDLLDEVLSNGWTGIYLAGTTEKERREEEWSTRTYVYEKGGQHFRKTWNDNLVGSQWKGFSTERYWDSKILISQAEYDKMREGNTRLDTPKNAENLQKQKQERTQARQQEESRLAAIEAAKPGCPQCRHKMVKRKGPHGDFWGCPDYPKCKGTRRL